jgi:hypothetical protein
MRFLSVLLGVAALIPSLVSAYTNPVIYEDLVRMVSRPFLNAFAYNA